MFYVNDFVFYLQDSKRAPKLCGKPLTPAVIKSHRLRVITCWFCICNLMLIVKC